MSETTEPLIYDPAGRGIKAAERVGLNQYCPCWRISTFSGIHESYCPIAQVAAVVDAIAAERDTEVATVHQALAQSEAQAAALRDAISRYLADVTLGSDVLTAVLWETEAGVAIERELHELRENAATLERQLIERDRQVETMGIAMDDLWARLLAPWPVRLQRWLLQRWERK